MDPSASTQPSVITMKSRLFDTIMRKPDVFYRSQQKDEPDLSDEEKRSILEELFNDKPAVFLERYHAIIDKEYLNCFPKTESCQLYLDIINARPSDTPKHSRAVRNRRFLAMQRLKESGDYFSLEKMRERDPSLFDIMVGEHLLDSEKIQLRPTVEPRAGSHFSNLMEQFDESQRITERRKRHFAEWESCMKEDRTDRFMSHVAQGFDDNENDFEMEFDSDDDEGREAEAKRKRQTLTRYTVDKELPEQIFPDPSPSTSRNVTDEAARQLSELQVNEVHPEDPRTGRDEMEDDDTAEARKPPGIEHGAMIDEFRSFMEERFLRGEDQEFVDYEKIDRDEESELFSKWRAQDLEDSYFADIED